MQKLIAKYGTAAHLALLAAAPLFLFPFFDAATVATTLLWLSIPAASWVVLEPSVRGGERRFEARRRVLRAIVRDPLFWVSLVVVAFAGCRWLNTGIQLAYDAEEAKWHVAEATFPLLPGAVEGAGYLPFAGAVALTILLQGCRHALGRSARMAYLLVSSALAGVAATVAVVMVQQGVAAPAAAMAADPAVASFVGTAFALHLIGGTVAIVAAFESRWNLTMPLFVFSLGGSAAGAFAFAPPFVSAVFGAAAVLLFAYSFAFANRALRSSGAFKMLVVSGIALTLGGLLVAALMPEKLLAERIDAFRSFAFLSDGFLELRRALSAIAFKTWATHLWIGTGLESFSLDFRFGASPADWALVPLGARAVPNGGWQLLAERGLVGAVALALPLALLAFTYVRRLVGGVSLTELPHPACLVMPLAVVALAVTGAFDGSFLRTDVLIAAGGLLAVSANSFPILRRKGHG